MPFPTAAVIDTFARANSTLDTSLACSDGIHSWTAGKINDGASGSNGTIASNQLRATADAVCDSFIAASNFGPETEVYATFPVVPITYAFLAGRIANAGAAAWNGYAVIWIPPTTWQLRRYDAGSSTVIATTTAAFVNNDQIGLSVIGTAVTGYLNGAALLTIPDATYAAAGKIGFEFSDNTARMVNFGGGTYIPPASSASPAPYIRRSRRTAW